MAEGGPLVAFICEDVGTTKRGSMTPSRALRIWEQHKGICVLCGVKISVNDDWYVEHIRALELGGPDTDDNCGPAHYYHKYAKDAADHSAAAAAKRKKRVHLGIKNPRRRKLRSRGFAKAPPQHSATKPLERPLPERREP